MDLQDETQFLGEEEGEEETQSSIVTNALQQTTLNLAGSPTTSQSIKSTPTSANCNKKKLAALVPAKEKRMKPEDELLSLAIKRFKEAPKKSEEPKAETEDEVYGKYLAMQIGRIKNEERKEFLKMKIQQLLYEAQFGDSWSQPQ